MNKLRIIKVEHP